MGMGTRSGQRRADDTRTEWILLAPGLNVRTIGELMMNRLVLCSTTYRTLVYALADH